MKKIITIFAILFSITLPVIAADTITVTGRVVDSEGALPGAYVLIEGTRSGTSTDTDGNFTLNNIPQDSKIQISYMGYQTQTIPAKANMETIELEPDSEMLDDVVVTDCNTSQLASLHATALEYNKDLDKCVPTKCVEPRYKLENHVCVDQVGKPCSTDKIVTGKYKMSTNDLICAADTCKCGYEKKGNDCVSWDDNKCSTPIPNAKEVYRTCDWDDTEICEVVSCNDGYKPNSDGDGCVEKLTECTDDQKKEHPNATDFGIKPGTETCIALACKCGYDPTNGECTEWPKDTTTGKYTKPCTGTTKPSLPKNAKTGTMQCNGETAYCEITACISDDYTLNTEKNTCDSNKNQPCTHSDKNAKSAEYKRRNGKLVCVITDCNDKYNVNKDGTKCVPECECGNEYDETTNSCVPWDKACNDTQKPKLPANAATGTKECDSKNKPYCEVTNCNDGYRISDDKKSCTSIRGDQCDDDAKKIDSNATAGQFKRVGDKMTCVITACATGYNVNKDGTKCVVKNVLSQEDSQKKIDELTENAEKMREKERSTENKLLGAAGIGAVGIGGMQLASAMAEKNADADAETAMRAYLSTFHCNYGGGINIAGGETDVELPGGNELIGLYGEYVNLANDLKTRKTALGMRPGIESEPILDSATSGLYDDISIGKTSGAYTSLARALMNPDGPDAIAWAQQKSDTAQKLKTGALTAGIGAVATLAGNLAINSGADKQDKSAKIAAEYEPLRKPFENAQKEFDSLPAKKCSEFAGTDGNGTSPNCTCKNPGTEYFHPEHGCQKCENNKIYNSTSKRCECPSDKPNIDANGNCVARSNNNCQLTGLVDSKTCKCIENATENSNKCVCDSAKHFTESSGKCICENGYEEINKSCIKIPEINMDDIEIPAIAELIPTPQDQDIERIARIEISSDTAFQTGQSTITSAAKEKIEKFKKELNLEIALLPAGTEYCIYVTGHTDRTQFKQGSNMNNTKLSENRANAVRNLLTTAPYAIAATNISSTGVGEQECKESIYTHDDDARCRKVSILATTGKCWGTGTSPKQ